MNPEKTVITDRDRAKAACADYLVSAAQTVRGQDPFLAQILLDMAGRLNTGLTQKGVTTADETPNPTKQE